MITLDIKHTALSFHAAGMRKNLKIILTLACLVCTLVFLALGGPDASVNLSALKTSPSQRMRHKSLLPVLVNSKLHT